MLGPTLIDPASGETFLKLSMEQLLKDWTGGCESNPGNSDVIRVLLYEGVIDVANLRILAHRLANKTLDEIALASIIHEFLKSRKVRIRLTRHALKYHKVNRKKAKADLRELEKETAEIMRKAGLQPWGEQ